jgi:hypothetical protein
MTPFQKPKTILGANFVMSRIMQLSDFNFDLPDELIARYPLESRVLRVFYI